MTLSPTDVLQRLLDFQADAQTRAFRAAMGLAPSARRHALFADFPEWQTRDVEQSLAEKLSSATLDASRRPRFEAAHRAVTRRWLEARVAEAFDEADDVERDTEVASIGLEWRAGPGLLAAPRQGTPEARRRLELDCGEALWRQRSAWARAADTIFTGLAQLHAAGPEAALDALLGKSVATRADDAARLLRETDDAYRDLLGFMLKRFDERLRPGAACSADLLAALDGPWLLELFRKEELRHAMTRCLDAMGLDPGVGGQLKVHAGASVSAVFDVSVPDDVRLTLHEAAGLDAYGGLFHAWGLAQHRARVASGAHVVERLLGDPAVPLAMGALFEGLLCDEGFLKWALRLPASRAREAARAVAFRQLTTLRRDAGALLAGRALLHSGPVPSSGDDYVSAMQAALHVSVPRGRRLVERDLLLDGVHRLDSWALAHSHFEVLRDRFNEDHWRNPAAGGWLSALAAAGQRDDAHRIIEARGGAPSLSAAGARRISVMGA